MSGPAAAASMGSSMFAAIAQYMSSAEARKMAAKERKELQKLLDAVKNPQFDYSSITPEQYKVVARYVPEAAAFVEEARPELLSMDTADAKMSKEAQREALQRLRAQGQGNDPLAAAELEDALARAASANRGRRDAVKEDFSRRGQLGSTQEMLAQLLGTQQVNETAADNSRAAYIEAQRRKLQSLRDSASLAGAIRDDEFRTESRNDDIINTFNARLSTRKQSWADGVAQARNEGQRFNIMNEQDVANRNTSTGNSFAVNERDRQDKLKQQTYDNDMGRVKTRAGVTDMARADAFGAARDRNSAIAGANEGVQSGLAYYNSGQQKTAPEVDDGYTSASSSLSSQPVWQGDTFEEDNDDPLKRRYKTNRGNA